jgi:hypothetical protein
MLQPQLKARVRHGAYVCDINKVADAVLARVQRLASPAVISRDDSRRASEPRASSRV